MSASSVGEFNRRVEFRRYPQPCPEINLTLVPFHFLIRVMEKIQSVNIRTWGCLLTNVCLLIRMIMNGQREYGLFPLSLGLYQERRGLTCCLMEEAPTYSEGKPFLAEQTWEARLFFPFPTRRNDKLPYYFIRSIFTFFCLQRTVYKIIHDRWK